MVAGQWVVEHGTIPGLDLPALLRRHGSAAAALRAT
jgi:8-oxoguanine deaminase